MDDGVKLPVADAAFWAERVWRAVGSNEIHKAVWDIDVDTWNSVQATQRGVLRTILRNHPTARVLDCGCGFGALSDCLPPGVGYTGVDISPDLIRIAQAKYPSRRFKVGDLSRIAYPDRSFDFAVCRSLEGMIMENLGVAAWHEMEAEMLRVADSLVLLSYGEPEVARVTDSSTDAKEFRANRIEVDWGSLTYRVGKDRTAEIYDLMVDQGHRRRGVGRRLVERLFLEPVEVVYGFTREQNSLAVKFYRSLGFSTSVVKGFYRGGNAVMFVRQVQADPARRVIT